MDESPKTPGLRQEIQDAINRASAENGSNTPDHILADFLCGCLKAFDEATRAREKWYGYRLQPGMGEPVRTDESPEA